MTSSNLFADHTWDSRWWWKRRKNLGEPLKGERKKWKKFHETCIAWRNVWYLKIVTFFLFLHSCWVEERLNDWMRHQLEFKYCVERFGWSTRRKKKRIWTWSYGFFMLLYYSISEDGFDSWFCNFFVMFLFHFDCESFF